MKITLIFSRESTSNNRLEEPATPIIPEPSKVNNAMLSIWEIPFIGLALASGLLEIKVP